MRSLRSCCPNGPCSPDGAGITLWSCRADCACSPDGPGSSFRPLRPSCPNGPCSPDSPGIALWSLRSCGPDSARDDMEWTLRNRGVLRYLQTGESRPDGVVWRWIGNFK